MTALWLESPGRYALRDTALPVPGPGEVVVRASYSGISRGTERLVFRGEVPASQHAIMRAPFQEGEFPGPVKYGYLSVGVREDTGATVFCLYPHQDRYVVPESALVGVPESVPAARAVLAGTVETAVNALWDAGPRIGDRIAVIGAGMVGACVAAILAGLPGARVELVDVVDRSALAAALGVSFAFPPDAAGDCDLVVHASASESGLARALELLGPEGEVVELSWYGDRAPRVPLGEAFHSRRLTIRSTQVGTISPARAARRTHADRLRLALDLLADPRFDALVAGEIAFADLPSELPRILAEPSGLLHRVVY